MKHSKKLIAAVLVSASLTLGTMSVQAGNLEDKISEVQTRNSQIDSEKASAEQKCIEITDQIERLNEEIEYYQSEIDARNDEIDTLLEKYSQAEEERKEHYDSIVKNLNLKLSDSSMNILSKLFDSDSAFVKSAGNEYLKRFSNSDRKLLEAYLDLCNEIKNEEEQILEAKQSLEDMKKPYEEEKKNLEALFAEQSENIAALEAELGSNNEHLSLLIQELEEYNQRQAEAEIIKRTAAGLTDEGKGILVNPCPAGRLTYGVGYREDGYHKGIDLVCSTGNDIYAALGGVVTTAGYSSSAGNWIVIDHQNGMVTKYMHCSALYVSAGQTVTQGQCIAAVGNTGSSETAHLHFQVEVNGSVVDPYLFL